MVMPARNSRAERRASSLRLAGSLTAIAGSLTAITGCASYQSKPLDARASVAEFDARRLDDPKLATFAANVIGADQSFPPSKWDLDALGVAALYFHPDLATARAHLASSEAAIAVADQRPNPRLALAPEWVGNGSGASAPWVLGGTLEIPWELDGKRRLRRGEAELERDLSSVDLADAIWNVETGVREAWVELALERSDLELSRATLAIEREHLALLEKLAAAGEIAALTTTTARIAVDQGALVVARLESRAIELRTELARAIGVPANALAGLELDAEFELEKPPDAELAQELALFSRTDLHRAALEFDLADLRVRRAVAEQWPDLSFAPGYTWDEGEHKFALGLALDLPLFHDQRAAIAEANAKREEARAHFEAVQLATIGAIRAALERYRHALAERTAAEATLAIQVEREARVAKLVERGESDRLELSNARLERAAVAREALDARRRVEDACREIENAIERPLDAPLPKELERKEKP